MKVVKFKLRHRRMKKLSIKELASCTLLEQNYEEDVSVSPKYINQDQYELSYPVVDIKLYHFKNVFCNVNSASFVTQDLNSIYIEEFPYIDCEQANYKSGFLIKHDSNSAYIRNIKINKVKNIETVIFLGGNGSSNFYHWMIEIAPKLLLLNNDLLKDLNVNKILINECVVKNDNYARILEQCTSHLIHVEFVYINQEDSFFINNLYFINTFNQTVYNFTSIQTSYQTTTIYNANNLESLRCRLYDGVLEKRKIYHKKLFILRNESAVSKYNKRTYNQDEVFKFFEQEGFVGIYLDSFTIDEQISIFNNADFIVGPTGASWSNLIFAKSTAKAISWLPEQLKYFDTYSTLAHLRGVDMTFLKYKTADEYIHGPYNINVNDIADIYYEMIAE